MDITGFPVPTQSVLVATEVRLALLGSPGSLLRFAVSSLPQKPNKRLLLERAVDGSASVGYLCRCCERNDRFWMDENVGNLLQLLLPAIGEVISCRKLVAFPNGTDAFGGSQSGSTGSKWGAS